MLAKADNLVGLQNHCCTKRCKLPWQLQALNADACLYSAMFSIFWIWETFAATQNRQIEKHISHTNADKQISHKPVLIGLSEPV